MYHKCILCVEMDGMMSIKSNMHMPFDALCLLHNKDWAMSISRNTVHQGAVLNDAHYIASCILTRIHDADKILKFDA